MPKLTVLIPCKDERLNIRPCIQSVRGIADEILVADSGSTDGTLDVVRQLGGCRIIRREFIDYANFKNWAIPQAAHPWILVLDADERVTEELAAEIRSLLSTTPPLDAYALRRQNYFLGYPIRHCGWNSPTVIRLFRRDVCRYGNRRVHENLEVPTGKVGELKGRCLHYTCRTLSQFIEKQVRYALWSAEDMHAAGCRVRYPGVLLRPLIRFCQLYVFRAGFLDGAAGLVVCMTTAFYTFLKYARLWELNTASGRAKESADVPSSVGQTASQAERPPLGSSARRAA